MKKDSNIEFLRTKNYLFVEEIGQGGTGKTILIKDDTINEVFVCKKYSPFYKEHQELYFKYFIDEIKLLHTVYHKNIVRVFNYYLYPEQKTGYILMEHINGKTISEYLKENPDKLEDVFLQTIEGFRYLEENNILHRDIRPENILISNDGLVKIIDFGFGKFVDFDSQNKSISLNWRYSIPNEFSEKVYDFKTEVYFIGKLFEEIIKSIGNINFKFSKITYRMILQNYDIRTESFFNVYREIIDSTSIDNVFTVDEKKKYQNFANNLMELYSKVPFGTKYNKDIEEIIKKLEELYKNSLLENEIQNNNKLTTIFIDGMYSYYPRVVFSVNNLLSIIQLLKSISQDKQKIILNHLWERFDTIERYAEKAPFDVDLPF